MINLTALENLTQPSFNVSSLNNSQEIMITVRDNANTASDGYFGLIVMLVLFFWLFYYMFKTDGVFKFDALKSLIIASGVTTIFGIVLILGDLISSFQHVIWFAILLIISLIATWIKKNR